MKRKIIFTPLLIVFLCSSCLTFRGNRHRHYHENTHYKHIDHHRHKDHPPKKGKPKFPEPPAPPSRKEPPNRGGIVSYTFF